MRLSIQIEFDKTLDLDTMKDSVIVGRSKQCDFIIPHESISRQHCRIDKTGDKYFITDLGSANGVFIDGKKLSPQKKTLYLPIQQLSLGSMDCAITEITQDLDASANKIVSSKKSGDFTSTIRLARIELNRPSLSLELEKKQQSRGPRNPVTANIQGPSESSGSKGHIIIIAGVIILLLVWLLGGR